MNNYSIRAYRPGDEEGLRALWRSSFPEDDNVIRAFFDTFLTEQSCLLAEADGQIVSAMYILDGPDLWPFRKQKLTSAYTYALATLPEYRGRGIGTAVYKACCEAIWDRGIDAACVLPEKESLFPFYQAASGARVLASIRETRYTREELKGIPRGLCGRIETLEYAGIREMLLGGEPHASMPESFFDWQDRLSEFYGGDRFVAGEGVALAEMDGNTCIIKELLCPVGGEKEATASVAAFCRAEEYIVRAPVFWEGPGECRPWLLAAFREEPSFPLLGDLWWGYGFD